MRDHLFRLMQSRLALFFPIPFWALVVGLAYYHNSLTIQYASFDLARQRGEVAFQLIQTMRHWNAIHGGVYAPLTEQTPENPWLDVPDKTIRSLDGVMLTKLNPAYMTRQIAELLRGSELEIHLTSLKLMNPGNRADPWEANALAQLDEKGGRSVVEIVGDRFRYMAPLYIDQSCLACHARMGYQIGDMRGGLSVSFSVDYARRLTSQLRHDSIVIHLVTFALLSLTGAAALAGLRRLLISLQRERDERESIIVERTSSLKQEISRHRRSQEALSYLAHHDELTGARNRRWILEQLKARQHAAEKKQQPLSLLMLDIDHFKQINDRHGHQIGDEVLTTAVTRLHRGLRQADQLGRYGGEEFLVVLPGAGQEEAELIAQRLRQTIADATFQIENHAIHITISIGLACMEAGVNLTPDTLINRADMAMYQAKQTGRNRVVCWNETMAQG